jgi:ubiquinone/menaquinone biosynthesis C-methylase UbiE
MSLRNQSNIIPTHSTIPLSDSDRLLHSWGYDLVNEYFLIAEHIPTTDQPLLELATGTGRMCAVLSHTFPVMISGDITLDDLPRARQRIVYEFQDRIRFVQLDMEHLPFRSHSIHTVVCMNTLHEVTAPLRCIDEILRVLHPDGKCVIGDFTARGFAVMQKIHEQVYHNNHTEGIMPIHAAEEILRRYFCTVEPLSTPLNMTFIAQKKK